MTVFKGYLKIAWSMKGYMILFFSVFLAVTVIFSGAGAENGENQYEAQSQSIALTGEKSSLAQGLETYLSEIHNVQWMENEPELLQENLFYRNVDYIVHLPEKFYEQCIEDGKVLNVTSVPGSYNAIYVNQQINSYLNHVRIYHAAGYSEQESINLAAKVIKANISVVDTTGGIQEAQYTYFFGYMPYLFISVGGFIIGGILIVFRRKEVSMRIKASAVSGKRVATESLLAITCIGVGLWLVTLIVGVIIYKGQWLASPGAIYYMINTLAMLLVAISMAYLIGNIVRSHNALTGIVNVLSLGMCFLCGVFVPMEFMGNGIKQVAMFLPVFWYEKVNNLLGEYSGALDLVGKDLIQGIGMQILFAAVFVGITMVIVRVKEKN